MNGQIIPVENGFQFGERFIPQYQQRTMGSLVRAEDVGQRSALFSVSSEEPYYRWFLNANEVLDHSEKSVDLTWLQSSRAPFLFNHNHNFYIGRIERAYLEDFRTYCEVKFKERGQAGEIYQDLQDGILAGNTSIGYQIHEMQFVESGEEVDTVLVTKWEPSEASLVVLPADKTVGYQGEMPSKMPEEEEKKTFSMAVRSEEKQPITEIKEDKPVSDTNGFEAQNPEELRQQEIDRQSNIRLICEQFGVSNEKRDEFLQQGASAEYVVAYCRQNKKPATPTAAPSGFLSNRERKRYSLMNVLRWQLGMISEDKVGFEREVSHYIAQETDRAGRDPKGLYVPTYDLSVERAALNTSTIASGGANIETDLDVANFTEALLNETLMFPMGVRLLTGLNGPIDIPIEDGTPTVYWIGEGGLIPESTSSFALASLRMKEVAAITPVTNRMMLQSSLDLEAYIRDILVRKIAIEIDRAIINGSGTQNEPLGLLKYPGLLTASLGTNGGEVGWDQVIDLQTALGLKNAKRAGCGYITNPKVEASLRKKQKFAGDSDEIWQMPTDPNSSVSSLAGYIAGCTNQVPSNFKKGNSGNTLSALIFAYFPDIIAGEFGVMEVLANPFGRGFYNNMVDIKATLGFDVTFVRDGVSFAAYKDVIASSGANFTRQG